MILKSHKNWGTEEKTLKKKKPPPLRLYTEYQEFRENKILYTHILAPTKCQFPAFVTVDGNVPSTLKRQNPYQGEGTLSQFPVGSPPPPHPGAKHW